MPSRLTGWQRAYAVGIVVAVWVRALVVAALVIAAVVVGAIVVAAILVLGVFGLLGRTERGTRPY